MCNAIFWITATDLSGLLLGFQNIARETGCTNPDETDSGEVATRVVKWLAGQGRWLLVLDNLDDIRVVRDYLPDTTNGGHILITTRNPFTNNIPAQGLEVALLDEKDAIKLLLLRAELEHEKKETYLAASAIVKELQFLPLAIEQAAAYIGEESRNIFTFREIYSRYRKQIHLTRPEGNWPYHAEIGTTYLLSFVAVDERNQPAADLLRLFAFLNPDGILVEFLKAGHEGLPYPLAQLIRDDFALNEALKLLEQFSLVRRLEEGQVIWIHRLVQAVIKDELGSKMETQFMEVTTAIFLCAFPRFEVHNREICRKYQSQVLGPLNAISKFRTEAIANLSMRVGSFLYFDGKLHDAAALQEKVLEAHQRILGDEHPDTLTSMNNLAGTYGALGRTKDAAALQEKVLEAQERILGDEHPDTLTSMNNLATTYGALARTKDAAALPEHVLDVHQRILGDEHPDTLTSMNNLAGTYGALGRTKDAAALKENVLDLHQRILGDEHPDTLTSMNNLA